MVEDVRISVVMAVYNGRRYLKEQLDSVLEQLTKQDEVIVSDDGSKDGSIELVEQYQKKDDRIRLIRGPGQGVKKNIEYAVAQSRGTYIFLADQDDVWMPGKVECVMEQFMRNGCPLVIHDARVFAEEDKQNVVMESFFAFKQADPGILKNIIRNGYIGCCMAFHARLKPVILPIPADIEMHDQWIGVLSEYYAGAPVFIRRPLLWYRRHGENQSGLKHYGIGKMIRNRAVFMFRFLQRIRKISRKEFLEIENFKKNDDC